MILQSFISFMNFFVCVSSIEKYQIKVFKSYGHVSNFICKVLLFTTLNLVEEKNLWDKNLFSYQCQKWHIPIKTVFELIFVLEISQTQEILILTCALRRSMWWNHFQCQLSVTLKIRILFHSQRLSLPTSSRPIFYLEITIAFFRGAVHLNLKIELVKVT